MTASSVYKKAKPGPKKQKDSKRNSDEWVAFSAFLRPVTRKRLQTLDHALKLCGINNPDGQSEAIEAALAPYLNKMEKQLIAKGIDPRLFQQGLGPTG